MSLLSTIPTSVHRGIFPGEIEVSLFPRPEDEDTWVPSRFNIEIQYTGEGDLEDSSWRLVTLEWRGDAPYQVAIDMYSDEPAETVLKCASRDFRLFFGEELATELSDVMLNLLEQQRQNPRSPGVVSRLLRFNTFGAYSDLYFHLAEMVTWPQDLPFDRDAFALRWVDELLEKTWSRDAEAQLKWYLEQRHEDAEAREACLEEVTDFLQTIEMGLDGTQQLRDSILVREATSTNLVSAA